MLRFRYAVTASIGCLASRAFRRLRLLALLQTIAGEGHGEAGDNPGRIPQDAEGMMTEREVDEALPEVMNKSYFVSSVDA